MGVAMRVLAVVFWGLLGVCGLVLLWPLVLVGLVVALLGATVIGVCEAGATFDACGGSARLERFLRALPTYALGRWLGSRG